MTTETTDDLAYENKKLASRVEAAEEAIGELAIEVARWRAMTSFHLTAKAELAAELDQTRAELAYLTASLVADQEAEDDEG